MPNLPTPDIPGPKPEQIKQPKPEEQQKRPISERARELLRITNSIKGQNPNPDAILQEIASAQQPKAEEAPPELGPEVVVSKLAKQRLQPKTETDRAGFKRKIYTANGRKFSFKGQEELPIYDTVSSSRTRLLGEAPKWVSQGDYQAYQGEIRKTEAQESAPEYYLANKTLGGVVELAVQFGSQDEGLVQLKDELSRGVYSPKAIELIDGLVALNYIKKGRFKTESSTDAEAVMLMSLMGDPEAKRAVSQKVEAMRKLDKARVDRAMEENLSQIFSRKEPLNPHDLIAVHSTGYKPAIGANGEAIIPTTFDATNGKEIRNTIHVALNHKVEANLGGDWSGTDYVVVAPFQSMVEANGVPTMFNTVDTWWGRNPGDPLKWPDATIIEPGGDKVQDLFKVEGRSVKFRSESLETPQLSELATKLGESGSGADLRSGTEDAFLGSFQKSFIDKDESLERDWDTSSAVLALRELVYQYQNPQAKPLLSRLTEVREGQTETSLEGRIREMVKQSGVVGTLRPEVQDKDAAISQLANGIADRVRSIMRSQINKLAVNEAIRSRGFEVQPGGDYGWGGSSASKKQQEQMIALASQMGVEYGAHHYSVQANFEKKINEAPDAALDKDQANFNWSKYNPDFEKFISEIDPSTRRVLYASGLLTARN